MDWDTPIHFFAKCFLFCFVLFASGSFFLCVHIKCSGVYLGCNAYCGSSASLSFYDLCLFLFTAGQQEVLRLKISQIDHIAWVICTGSVHWDEVMSQNTSCFSSHTVLQYFQPTGSSLQRLTKKLVFCQVVLCWTELCRLLLQWNLCNNTRLER